jgi:hypothetical protein
VCPSGTAWDTANNQCSALPAEVNPVVPLDQVDPVTASIETITSNLGNYVPWIVGGLVAVMVLPAVLGRR